MKNGRSLFAIFILLSSSLYGESLQAADCDQSPYLDESYQLMLEEFAATCFNFDNNASPLAQQVKKQLKDSSLQNDRVRALMALSSIQQYLEVEYLNQVNAQQQNARTLHAAIAALKQSLLQNPGAPEKDLKTQWKLGPLDQLPDALQQLDFSNALTEEKCSRVGDGKCAIEFDYAANLIRVIQLANAAIDKYSDNYRAEALADRTLRRTKWDSYYDELTFQYPWELLVNNFFLEKSDKRISIDGNKLGFRDLPGSKMVLLHPEANLVYARNAVDEYDITVTLEAIGYEAFAFDDKGKIKNPWGVSVLAAYMGEPDKLQSGWTLGLLFKYNGYSLGVTDNHGEPGIVFNINLAQRIFDVKRESRHYYDEYQERLRQLNVLVEEGPQALQQVKKMYVIAD